MKKISLLLLVLIGISSSVYAANIKYGTYYDCPSMFNYTPIDVATFCANKKLAAKLLPPNTTCQEYYNEIYRDTNKEFNTGQCRQKDRRYVKTELGITSCTVDYITKPTPQIVGQGCNNTKGEFATGSIDAESTRCLNILYSALKQKYPNIKKENENSVELF